MGEANAAVELRGVGPRYCSSKGGISILRGSPSTDLYPYAPGNKLLAAVGARELAHLLRECKYVVLQRDSVLCDAGETIRGIWFPVAGLVSVMVVMREGSGVEVASAGREGMIGIPALLGYKVSPQRCVVQISGAAWRMPAPALFQAFDNGGSLQPILRSYLHARLQHAYRAAACNLLHSVKQRLAERLLRLNDQVGVEQFPVTHESLSQMLGTQRSTVTLAARALEIADLIRYKRGQIAILDRQGLERSACECYRAIKRHFEMFAPSA